jgi:toxin ParE1/3/4
MRCGFTIIAKLDLEDIGDYIARDNPQRAITFVDEIRQRCFAIVQAPRAAPLRESLGKGVRVVPYGQYLIFYTVQPDEVRIERVLHGARDIDRSFFH